eukprot:2118947-Lingulodinium_polyedra.AAC.1
MSRQYATLLCSNVLQGFRREQPPVVKAGPSDKEQCLTWSDFNSQGHDLSIEGKSLTGTRTWPSFDPQTGQVHQAFRALARNAKLRENWQQMS